jgi:hypothetical protein
VPLCGFYVKICPKLWAPGTVNDVEFIVLHIQYVHTLIIYIGSSLSKNIIICEGDNLSSKSSSYINNHFQGVPALH